MFSAIKVLFVTIAIEEPVSHCIVYYEPIVPLRKIYVVVLHQNKFNWTYNTAQTEGVKKNDKKFPWTIFPNMKFFSPIQLRNVVNSMDAGDDIMEQNCD